MHQGSPLPASRRFPSPADIPPPLPSFAQRRCARRPGCCMFLQDPANTSPDSPLPAARPSSSPAGIPPQPPSFAPWLYTGFPSYYRHRQHLLLRHPTPYVFYIALSSIVSACNLSDREDTRSIPTSPSSPSYFAPPGLQRPHRAGECGQSVWNRLPSS